MFKRPFVDNQIRAAQVRAIDEQGKNLGILNLEIALKIARERNLNLVQVTEKVKPPVCRIMDYGKYLYSFQKKTKIKKAGELKTIRLGFNISPHDLETRAKQAENFLKKGDKIRVEMTLRGREKALGDFAKEKFKQFLGFLDKLIPIKTERELKREARGFTMIITKA
ncbi:MAG: translation initiation factor IF-3 [Candidatus Nealsonbacteria bacterium CG08_land_8_20_14_0_20_38_20]|uniref:Translation initiation factor IF-3 n=1 Tax=Candidatus Nealsonbacteria bacterium CG08_land_8_20_14_0_20_38_20 TaxID=1974705 RepID=A0A2H0YMH6_9BACT|nr:MAG: translation initiation factor IF-3 [Candidatus Nealsonbacteria bacterium CG08_land_8_20_14_0_20_38_20]